MNLMSGAIAAKHNANTIGIRPEHISIVTKGGDLPGTILLTEHLGSDSFLHVDGGEAGRLTVRASGDFAGKPGDKIALQFDPARIHHFDAKGRAVR
jgi:multiple sugar transport system ATP-binding protein